MGEVMADEASCFHKKSLVRRWDATSGSWVPSKVGELTYGDIVLAYDEATGKFCKDEILYVHDHAQDYSSEGKAFNRNNRS